MLTPDNIQLEDQMAEHLMPLQEQTSLVHVILSASVDRLPLILETSLEH